MSPLICEGLCETAGEEEPDLRRGPQEEWDISNSFQQFEFCAIALKNITGKIYSSLNSILQ